MTIQRITPEELWSRQQISSLDTDYKLWDKKRTSIQAFSQISPSCIFTVDVFKKRYDFASDHFTDLFGYNSKQIKTIRKQGNLLEERIHPDDRAQLPAFQIEHGLFIYSLPQEERNDYQQVFQIRMQNVRQQYVNVISRHRSSKRTGKARLTQQRIAYKLHLSIYTVNNHRKHILSKLQAGNAIEAINRAEDYGLLY